MNLLNSKNFKSARLNIASIADNHGDLLALPQLMKAIQVNKKEIFSQSGEKGVFNMLSIAGDFFMNPIFILIP